MRLTDCFWCMACSVLPAIALSAQGGQGATSSPLPLAREVEGGWPTDRTITVAGHDFFRAFAALWHDKPLSERYPIVVRELPSASRGTQVLIDYGQERVFQAYLPASRAKVPALAARAVELCYQNVIDSETRQLLFREADLAPNEI